MLQAAAQPLQVCAGLVQGPVPQLQEAARFQQQCLQGDRPCGLPEEAGREEGPG